MKLWQRISMPAHRSLNWMLTQMLLRDPLDFEKRRKMKIQLQFTMLHATKCHFIPRHLTLYGLLLMPWQWWIIWIYFKQNPFWRHNSGGKYTDWGTTWISALMGPSLLHRGNVSSLGNILYTSRTCGSSQWTFYFDFSSLRQTHFCWQGRPTHFESSCPPFGHVFHATIFLFHVHYMWICNIECISADEIIADEMETATNHAGYNRQHGNPALISM